MPETASAPSSSSPPASPAPTLPELFVAFALIALCGFGGVLAWSRRMLVEERRWMTAPEFDDAYALCQFLPGPNVVNLSVVFGRRIRGLPGAAVALRKDRLGLLAVLMTFASVGVMRWPIYAALAGLVPLSIAIAWVRR